MIIPLEQEFTAPPRLPLWLRQPLPDAATTARMKNLLSQNHLHTVCQSAACPNKNTCWQKGLATFMILGDTCTRACRFCAVKTGVPAQVDLNEPLALARTIKALNLRYVVITSVTREDLSDQGAGHFAKSVKAIRKLNPQIKIEILIPDFLARKDLLALVVESRPEVIGHNLETVHRLASSIRPQADYARSLAVLRMLKELGFKGFTKSGIMLGMGETPEDIFETMQDLRDVHCDLLTLGQYLAPSQSRRHVPVSRFVPPEEFEKYSIKARRLGFWNVFSGPLIRSSFLAEEGYEAAYLHNNNTM